MRTDTPQPIRLSDYRPPAFLIDEVLLTFDLQPNATRVTAKIAVRRNGDHAAPLRFNGERLTLISAAIDGRLLGEAERTLDAEFLTIPGVPDAFVLETEVEIDPENNKALEGLYMSGGRFCTQCEARASARSPSGRTAPTCWRASPCASRPTASSAICSPTAI